jgi:SAM-dependent methyltransferase
MNIYDSKKKINTSFSPNFIPEEQLQTQWAELLQIKKAIYSLYQLKKKKITILDIGVGTGRIIKHLSLIPEIWSCIENYTGIDNNENCLNIAKKNITDWKLSATVTLINLQANNINTLKSKYDIIMTTWFTPGNFYPTNFNFFSYNPLQQRLSLVENAAFTKVWTTAYKMLNKNGMIILGSCYCQNNATRLKQEKFYTQCKMTIITDEKDSFTATKEGFWSQRLTLPQIKNYFKNVPFKSIKKIDLDVYNFAFQIQLLK